jgi:hypothetical protein
VNGLELIEISFILELVSKSKLGKLLQDNNYPR